MQPDKKRKLTGTCEMKFVQDDRFKPMLRNCGEPARFYPAHIVGMFGAYICDACFTKKYSDNS